MKTIRRPISILLAILMVVGMFTMVPISAGASTWTFKLNSNFSGEWNADTDVVSEQPIELNLAEGDYEFQIVAYEDGTLSSHRGNELAGSFRENYSQIMYDNGGNAKFHADGGKYTLTYNAGDGVATIAPVYVAQIDETNYKTLEAAFAAASDGDTITLLADCAGNGIKVPQGKFANNGLTVDFNRHTYTIDGDLVGSTGTETLAFQLLKGNDITFQNGTIYSEKAKMLVQNYSNLALDNMTLTLDNPNYYPSYTLSNNNGNTDIVDTTINANPAGGFAFDVCRFSSYPSVHVAVYGDSVINGDVEIYAKNGDPKEGFSLTLDEGTMNGDIVVDPSAQTAIENNPANAVVTKANTFTQTAPEGFEWKNNSDGTSTLVALPYAAKIGDTKYRTLEEAFAAAVDGDTITLLADSTGNGIKVTPAGKFATGLTVDFDDYTYTIDGDLVGSTGTETLAFQLLKDNKVTFKNGTIYSEKAKMLVQNYCDLTLLGMTLTLNNPNYHPSYTLSNNNGDVVIDSTTINANPAGGFAFDVCRYSSYPSVNVTVTGDSEINGDVEISASKSDPKEGFSLTLESGTLNGDIVVDASAKGLIGDDNKVTKKDTFTQEAPADFEWVSNSDGTSSLAAIEYVAKIGDTKYRTLEAAFAAAVDGDTITVLADSAGNGIKVPQGKFNNNGLTVDFDGHTYTVDGNTVGSAGTETLAFQLLKDNKVTFENGAIYSEVAKMLINNYCDLTLDEMTLTLNNTSYDGAYTLSNNNGSAVINDTTINANPTTGSFAFDVCRYSSYPSIDVTVTGDSVINGDVEISASKGQAKDGFSLTLESGTMTGDIVLAASAETAMNAAPEKVSVTKAAGFDQEAPEGYMWVDTATEGVQTIAKAVAQIGTTNYATLEAAFAAAVDGDTITLLSDCAGNGIKVTPAGKFANGLTVDFDGHTYTVDGETVGSPGTETLAFQLLKNNKVTFKNGTIYSEKAKMLVQNYCDLTLDNMTLTLNNTSYNGAYTLSNNNGNTVIKDTTINANPTTGSFAFDVCRYSSYPSVDVTVTGDSAINGNVEIYASKGQAKDGFSLTLESGTMTGDIVVDPTAQSLIGEDNNVTKANSFTQEAPADFKWVDNGDGTSSLVAKDYVAQVGTTKYENLQDALDVVPNGGTVTVLKDITTSGNIFADGYVSGGNRTYTVDLGGYTVSGGTFIVADGNTVTFTNGTIESASYAIQNTATAIIDDTATVTSTATNASAVYGAAGSTTIIDGTVEGNKYGVIVRGGTLDVAGTVTAVDTGIDAIEGGVANINDGADVSGKFAVVAHKDSVINVEDGAEITGTSHAISGNGKAADGPYTINVTGGTLTATEGAGIYNPNAQGTLNISGGTVTGTTAVIAGENATTSISGGTFNTPVPENYCAEGYVPKDNGDGTYTVEEEVKDLFVGYGLTLHGDIGLIFYLDPAAAGLTANQVTSVSVDFTCDQYNGNYTASGNDLEKDGNYIKVKYYVPAAYMASDITAYNVKFNNLPVVCDDDTDTYSVQEYAQRIMANPVECGIHPDKADAAVTLMKEMLNYGAKAKAVFEAQMDNPEEAVYDPIPEYTMANVTANDVAEKIIGEATDMSTVHPEPDANFYSPSVVYLSKTTLRMVFLIPTGNGSTCTDEYDGHQGVWYYWAEVTDIPAAELDEQQEFEVNGVEFNYSALDYVKAVLNSNMDATNKALAASLFLYNQAANAYYTV